MCDTKTTTILGGIIGAAATGGSSLAMAGGALTGAAGGAAVGSALNPAKMPDVPALAATPTMPTMDSAGVAQARRLSIAQQMAQGGRSSTILSQAQSQTLGG